MKCVLNRLYETLCRDPELGTGGLEPTPSEFHADGFTRRDMVQLKKVTKSGADRLLQIEYKGTVKYQGYANGRGNRRRSTHRVMVRIGYFAGQSHNETHIVMGADDKKIGTYVQKLDNIVGTCSDLCIEKISYENSETITVDDQRYELQIMLLVQVF